MERLLKENEIVELVTNFLLNDNDWKHWHKDKTRIASLHEHWVDVILVWWKRNSEYFFIECKWKSHANSANSVNKECWLNALWQIITRMDTSRIIKKWKTKWAVNYAYKYWLWLYWESAQVALRRIPKEIAHVLNLHIFAVNDDWKVIEFKPKDFGKKYEDEYFK